MHRSLTNEAIIDLSKLIKSKTYQKGDFILHENGICKHIYFIEHGLVKLFFFNEARGFIMTFFRENMLFTEVNGYITQQPSKYIILALEETAVEYIHFDDLERLCKAHHCLETLFKSLFATAAINMTRRISELLEENVSNRYKNFVLNHGDILQRVSLGDVANYLGITQVSLSRIRTHK